ncbi:MAG: winged helix-turn-helix transcriptional regulator [Ferruginibacter sp.]|nr:winged helix-turn-helix transcriptional regulator [Ferruginibacter sp.]
MELRQLEKISKALGDVHRLKILVDMSACGGSIQCARIMNLTELAQPSVSHHIKTLMEAGLITTEKEGRNYSYLLNRSLLRAFIEQLSEISGK